MLQFKIKKQTFIFKIPGGTSRGVLTEKYAWFIHLQDSSNKHITGYGECSIIPDLSPDFENFVQYEQKLQELLGKFCKSFSLQDFCDETFYNSELFLEFQAYPSILFGLETALLDLKNGGIGKIFDSTFYQGKTAIPINGLIWMGDEKFMQKQIQEKLEQGYSCLKLKIGAIDFEKEINLLKNIRKNYNFSELILRVDANGAFKIEEAIEKLNILNKLDIHSIEQPIAAGNWSEMAKLCIKSPLAIALDEELIGIHKLEEKRNLLESIKPPYIILKPSLHGGIYGTKEWIQLAESLGISWWITSALESNVGLNAIANLPQLIRLKHIKD